VEKVRLGKDITYLTIQADFHRQVADPWSTKKKREHLIAPSSHQPFGIIYHKDISD
jgi:hypothetical protein